ncbi:MAG: hypothetical protein HQL38_04760 [Alphaproteobacteria bacterium]|nr:hypothetical protein [Alphaproteobacteria bacterium]
MAPPKTLPQQRLMLEILRMTGDVAITAPPDQSLIWRTLRECEQEGWLVTKQINPTLWKASLTEKGRALAKGPY